jgi:putative aldouronate transport system substrate-binding protein
VLNLTNYWNELNYFIKKNIDECCLISYEDYVRGMKAYNGNIYGVPGYSGSYHNQFSRWFILVYQPWLDKLGIDRYSIVTTEDYYNLLVKIRDTDLNGNGTKDEIPLISCISYIQNVKQALMSPFITCQPNYWINENGQIDVVFNRDGWREGIRYIRRLVKDGLLLAESFTQDEKQMTAIQLRNPNVVGGVARVSTTNIPSADPRYFSYFQIMPLQGPSGMREIMRVPLGPSQSGFISAHTRFPEAAFRLVDYMAGEEISNWTRNGPKNIGWFDPKPGELSPYEAQGFFSQFKTTLALAATTNWANVSNSYWANTGPRIYGEKYALGQALASTVSETEKNFYYTQVKDYVGTGNFVNDAKRVSGLVYNEEEQEVINSIYTPVLTYVDECWTRFVLGDLNIDSNADWNTYLRELSRMDIPKAIAATQACYNRVYGK